VRRLPWWVRPVLDGLVVAVVLLALLPWQTDLALPAALGVAAVVGLLWGLQNARDARRERAAERSNVGGLSAEDLRRAERVVAGEPPRDEEERDAAFRLATYRVAQSWRAAGPAGAALAGVVVIGTLLALQQSPWWWLAVVLAAVTAVGVLRGDRGLRRRAEELRSPPAQSSTRSFSPPE
jgi:membrane protein implicated in regulation of membrane protease activity